MACSLWVSEFRSPVRAPIEFRCCSGFCDLHTRLGKTRTPLASAAKSLNAGVVLSALVRETRDGALPSPTNTQHVRRWRR